MRAGTVATAAPCPTRDLSGSVAVEYFRHHVPEMLHSRRDDSVRNVGLVTGQLIRCVARALALTWMDGDRGHLVERRQDDEQGAVPGRSSTRTGSPVVPLGSSSLSAGHGVTPCSPSRKLRPPSATMVSALPRQGGRLALPRVADPGEPADVGQAAVGVSEPQGGGVTALGVLVPRSSELLRLGGPCTCPLEPALTISIPEIRLARRKVDPATRFLRRSRGRSRRSPGCGSRR